MISGPGNAALWGELLGKEIQYTGHNFDQWEQATRAGCRVGAPTIFG